MYNLQSSNLLFPEFPALHSTFEGILFKQSCFFIVFVISYVHLGFILYFLLFNESLLHYLSIICVMMVFA